jgi:hypothetical protein
MLRHRGDATGCRLEVDVQIRVVPDGRVSVPDAEQAPSKMVAVRVETSIEVTGPG